MVLKCREFEHHDTEPQRQGAMQGRLNPNIRVFLRTYLKTVITFAAELEFKLFFLSYDRHDL